MIRALSVALALALAAAGLQTYRLAAAERDHAEAVAAHAEKIGALQDAARLAESRARAEEQRRTAEVQKVADEAQQEIDRARADAAAAADAGQRLRDHIASITAAGCRGSGCAAAAGPGAPADTTASVLADVQRRLDAAADGIAGFADRAHAAGRACEKGYGALTAP